eukprot:2366345-Amphidinium_carterae.1
MTISIIWGYNLCPCAVQDDNKRQHDGRTSFTANPEGTSHLSDPLNPANQQDAKRHYVRASASSPSNGRTSHLLERQQHNHNISPLAGASHLGAAKPLLAAPFAFELCLELFQFPCI